MGESFVRNDTERIIARVQKSIRMDFRFQTLVCMTEKLALC